MVLDHKKLEAIHEKLRPIAERSPMIDSQNLAKLSMALIDALLCRETTSDLPTRHHQ
jgi:hypothetical protein